MKANPRIGPAAPAKRKRIPSERHNVAKFAGGGCLELEEEEEEGEEVEAGGEERPTRLEGTRAGWVCRRTLRTSRLFLDDRGAAGGERGRGGGESWLGCSKERERERRTGWRRGFRLI